MIRWLLVLGVIACKDHSESIAPIPITPRTPSTTTPKPEINGAFKNGDDVAVTPTAPTASHADWIPPAKSIPWVKPARTRNSQEEVLYGTWVAKVGDYATRSAFMADRVIYALDGSNKDLVTNIADAVAHDNTIATNCIWVELRPDFTGMRRECLIVNGEPTALDQNDLVTGAKKDLGTPLEWFIDEHDRNKLKIHFAADMTVRAVRGGKASTLVFRTWELQLDKPAGDNLFTVHEWVPEHDYALPTEYTYKIASQKFLDQK